MNPEQALNTPKKIEIRHKYSGSADAPLFVVEAETLRGLDIRCRNLIDANLRYLDLRDVNFYGSNLSGADLRGSNLYGSAFYAADLRYADLRDTDLRCSRLHGAWLGGTKINNVDQFLRAIGVEVAP